MSSKNCLLFVLHWKIDQTHTQRDKKSQTFENDGESHKHTVTFPLECNDIVMIRLSLVAMCVEVRLVIDLPVNMRQFQ